MGVELLVCALLTIGWVIAFEHDFKLFSRAGRSRWLVVIVALLPGCMGVFVSAVADTYRATGDRIGGGRT